MEHTEAQAKKMTVAELKEALKAKGLSTGGKKAELVVRLVAGGGGEAKKRKRAESSKQQQEEDEEKEEGTGSEPEFKETEDSCPIKKSKKESRSEEKEKEEEEENVTVGGIVGSLDPNSEWGLKLPAHSKDEFEKPYFKKILQFVDEQKKKTPVFPPDHEVLNALKFTSFEQVKVVIIGQDPYFKAGQAHGLCFSVKKGVTVPPSLKTIYKELEQDVKGFKAPKHGYLEEWARQGVLMLNATLTVNEGKANSHEKCGWQTFTDRILSIVNEKKQGVVFLLWGQFAIKKAKGISKTKHHILEAAHPSPLAGGKFLGCGHFSKCNQLLKQMGKEPIYWHLSP